MDKNRHLDAAYCRSVPLRFALGFARFMLPCEQQFTNTMKKRLDSLNRQYATLNERLQLQNTAPNARIEHLFTRAAGKPNSVTAQNVMHTNEPRSVASTISMRRLESM